MEPTGENYTIFGDNFRVHEAGLPTVFTLAKEPRGELRQPCEVAAPLVVNGGLYVGCALDRGHDEEFHEVTIKWR